MVEPCSFCRIDHSRIVHETHLSFAIRDGYPVSQGHTLIIPKRHIASFFDTTAEEESDMIALIKTAKQTIDKEFAPSGYNIAVNDGVSAGQTVLHLHIHLIPRYTGDVAEPRGGIRWIFPDKAAYWNKK